MKKAHLLIFLISLIFAHEAMAWRIIRISKRHHTSGDYRHVSESHNEIVGINFEIHKLSCRGNGAVVCDWEFPPRLTGYDNSPIRMEDFERLVDELYKNSEINKNGRIWLGSQMCYQFKFTKVEEEEETYYELELTEVER